MEGWRTAVHDFTMKTLSSGEDTAPVRRAGWDARLRRAKGTGGDPTRTHHVNVAVRSCGISPHAPLPPTAAPTPRLHGPL